MGLTSVCPACTLLLPPVRDVLRELKRMEGKDAAAGDKEDAD
jgi:hypothetical protein